MRGFTAGNPNNNTRQKDLDPDARRRRQASVHNYLLQLSQQRMNTAVAGALQYGVHGRKKAAGQSIICSVWNVAVTSDVLLEPLPHRAMEN